MSEKDEELEGAEDTSEEESEETCNLEENSEDSEKVLEQEEEDFEDEEEEVEFDLEAQIEEFRLQIEDDPDNCVHHYNLGEALQELKRFDEAIEEFELALELDTEKAFSAIIHFGLGNLFYTQLMTGVSSEVVKSSVGIIYDHKDKATITDVNEDDYRKPIGQFENSLKHIDLLQADEDLVEYISENAPKNIAHSYYKWGSDLIDKSRQLNNYGGEIADVKKAVKLLKKTLEIDPNNSAANLLANLGKKMLTEGWQIYDEYGFEAKNIPGTG